MSKIKWETIWQHDKVLPYILYELKEKIEKITPIEKIYVFGSRAKKPVEEWQKLEGKDWDIIVQAKCKITNAQIWTKNLNYHIDLFVLDEKQTQKLLNNVKIYKEIYPKNELNINIEEL